MARKPLFAATALSFATVSTICIAAHAQRTTDAVPLARVPLSSQVGYMEQAKGSTITKMFEDAYKSPLSIVILVSSTTQSRPWDAPMMACRDARCGAGLAP